MARPLKFTKARQTAALRALENGHTRTSAAAVAGVHYSTFYDLVRDNPQFSEAVELAEATAEAKAIAKAYANAESDDFRSATAADRWLEKRRRKDWGKHEHVSTDGEQTVRVEIVRRDDSD